jgi:hypothetical protein
VTTPPLDREVELRAEAWGRHDNLISLHCGKCTRRARVGRILVCGVLIYRVWSRARGTLPTAKIDWWGADRYINIGSDRIISKTLPGRLSFDVWGGVVERKTRPGRQFLDDSPFHTFVCVPSCGARWLTSEAEELAAVVRALGPLPKEARPRGSPPARVALVLGLQLGKLVGE